MVSTDVPYRFLLGGHGEAWAGQTKGQEGLSERSNSSSYYRRCPTHHFCIPRGSESDYGFIHCVYVTTGKQQGGKNKNQDGNKVRRPHRPIRDLEHLFILGSNVNSFRRRACSNMRCRHLRFLSLLLNFKSRTTCQDWPGIWPLLLGFHY